MGFGYVGNGGFPSSSSSNLSPLAPPFTVDRFSSRPNTTPLGNFTETSQPYGVPFSSSSHTWQYPQYSQPGADYISYCGSENDGSRATALPSANEYSYLGSELNNPPNVHWAPPNPNTTDLKSNLFSYGGLSKQWYAPNVSQGVDDNASSLGLNEANYDLLSASGLVPMVGSSQADYSQGLSSLEFPPPWGGYWNGLSEGKRGKRTDVDGSSHLKGTDLPASHDYCDYLKQGVVPVEYSRFEENPTVTQSKHADGCRREVNVGFTAKEQVGQNFGFIPTGLSEAHICETSTSSHLESPSLEPVAFSSNHHKSYNCSYEKGFQLFDSCINYLPVIRPPIFGTKYSVSDTVASKSKAIGDVTDVNRKDGSSYNRALEKEPLLPPSSDIGFLDANYLGFHMGRNDQHMFTAVSSSEVNVLAKSFIKNSVDHAIKVSEDHISNINAPHGFLPVDNTEAFKHTANNPETSDHHNPAEDSPCWKGAPAFSVSPPFESLKVVMPRHHMMKLEACDSSDLIMTQMFPPNNESVMGFFGEVGGSNFQKESLSMNNNKLAPPIKKLGAILPTNEHSVADPARLMPDSVQQIRSDTDQYLSNVINQIKQCNLLNTSKTDCGSIQRQTRPLYPKEVNFMHKSKTQLQAGDVDAMISASDTSEDGCIPLHTVENVLCSPPSEKDDGKPPLRDPNPIINVQNLADALHNISELLVLYSSGNGWGLEEQCSKTLEHAINNINMCLSKKILQSPRQKLLFPDADISHLPEEGAPKVRLHAMNEVGNATISQHDLYCRCEQKRIYSVSDMNFEKEMDLNSVRSEADAMWRDNMVQNIKVVCDENFQSEEDLSPETLLYNNLWLNAEAELCVDGFKARFDQVKIQMENYKSVDQAKIQTENCKLDKTKENAVADPIVNITSMSTPKANASAKQKAPVQFFRISSPRSDAKDVEASVMARFQILKWRGDDINTSNVEEKCLPDAIGLGFPSKTVGRQTGGKSFDVAVGSHVRHPNDHNSEKNTGSSPDGCHHEAVEESTIYLSDDPTTVQPFRKMMHQPKTGSGRYENTSSDWKHVLKEDIV